MLKVFPSDSELVEKLRKGDVKSFDLTYEKYAPKLYAFSVKYLKSEAEAEELVQSVFLKVWENQKNLKKEGSFKSYLFTIAYNEICNLFRERTYLRKYFNETRVSGSETSAETEQQIDYLFVVEHLDQIIARLPEKLRIVFHKSRGEGKSTREIARELGITSGTVDNYISEALKFIRNNLMEKQISAALFFALFLA